MLTPTHTSPETKATFLRFFCYCIEVHMHLEATMSVTRIADSLRCRPRRTKRRAQLTRLCICTHIDNTKRRFSALHHIFSSMAASGQLIGAHNLLSYLNNKEVGIGERLKTCKNVLSTLLVDETSLRAEEFAIPLPPKVRQHVKVSIFDWLAQQLIKAEKLKLKSPVLEQLWDLTNALCVDSQVGSVAKP